MVGISAKDLDEDIKVVISDGTNTAVVALYLYNTFANNYLEKEN